MDDHTHHQHPSRCCPSDDPRAVLDRLQAAPPQRLGYLTPNGWSGESEASFALRQSIWESAIAREKALLQQ